MKDRLTYIALIIVGVLMGLSIAGIANKAGIVPAEENRGVYYEAPTPEVASVEVLENGRTLYTLNNDLLALVSEEEEMYCLYLPFMGDHEIEYNSKEMLENGVRQYSENFGSYINEVVNNMLVEYDREQQEQQ